MARTEALLVAAALLLLGGPARGANEPNPDPARITASADRSLIRMRPAGLEETPAGGTSRDTANLIWALTNVAEGGTVRLAAGTFHVSRMIAIPDLRAVVEGAGRGRTALVARGASQSAPGALNPRYVFPMLDAAERALFFPGGVPSVFWFHESAENGRSTRLTLRDLAIRVEGEGPESICFGSPSKLIWSVVMICGRNSNYHPETDFAVSRADVVVERVDFVAASDPALPGGSNAALGLFVVGGHEWLPAEDPASAMIGTVNERFHMPFNATLRVAECGFRNFPVGGLFNEDLYSTPLSAAARGDFIFPLDARPVRIDVRGNRFAHCGWGIDFSLWNCGVVSPSDADVEIAGNVWEDTPSDAVIAGAGLFEHVIVAQDESRYRIEGNDFRMAARPGDNFPAIELLDFAFANGEARTTDAVVSGNRFSSADGFASSLFFGLAEELWLAANEFRGGAEGSEDFGYPGTAITAVGERWRILANDVSRMKNGPEIVLFTTDSVVVGEDASETVDDRGEGNRIIDLRRGGR